MGETAYGYISERPTLKKKVGGEKERKGRKEGRKRGKREGRKEGRKTGRKGEIQPSPTDMVPYVCVGSTD